MIEWDMAISGAVHIDILKVHFTEIRIVSTSLDSNASGFDFDINVHVLIESVNR